ncbi:MAG: aspartate ammonia-lyase, partial [Bdellovibrionales bacterium RIFOXYB2_FULL_36_6]
MKKYRTEQDSLGKKNIPADKYYGVQTQRAIENFPISGVPISHYPMLIKALAAVKYAAAKANMELHVLKKEIAEALMAAAQEILDGQHLEHFPIDVIQGGAGTSSNMNINEVLSNRALELLGHQKGDYQFVHPNNHANQSQSTNDVYPTAIRIAIIWLTEILLKEMENLKNAFLKKGEEFSDVIKMARTELREAVPITLGQEFHAYGVTIEEDIARLKEILKLCGEINMGATAVGTGINTKKGYAEKVCRYLSEITHLELITAKDLVEATSDAGVFVTFSSMLKRFAVKLNKICNDLRLMSASVGAGWGEIFLPAVQPGSSIMPGKVNPVIPEVLNQICFQVMGNDTTITFAAS